MTKACRSTNRCLIFLALSTSLATFFPATAGAAPPGFPDLSLFTEVHDGRKFTRPDKWANGYAFFRTQSGISCALGSGTWCYGDLPGLVADQKSTCTSVTRGNPSEPFQFEKSDKPCVPTSDDLLNPGEKLTFEAYGTTCAVGDQNLVACIDNWHNHGFVLQASGSWAF